MQRKAFIYCAAPASQAGQQIVIFKDYHNDPNFIEALYDIKQALISDLDMGVTWNSITSEAIPPPRFREGGAIIALSASRHSLSWPGNIISMDVLT